MVGDVLDLRNEAYDLTVTIAHRSDKGNPDRRVLEGKVEQRQAGLGIIGRVGFRYDLSAKDKRFTALGVL